MYTLAVGIGAGLVSALLFGVVISGSPLAMMLSFVAPLPIFIASLGWHQRAGLVAAAAGGIAIGAALNWVAGIAFILGWGLPAWWLGYLALLGRPGRDGTMEWYPLGNLLLWIALAAAAITLAGILALGGGSYEAFIENVQRTIDLIIRQPGSPAPAPGGPQPSTEALTAFIGAMPFLFAWNFPMILALNLWLAAKAVQISGRLPRPWPFIPNTRMPRATLWLLIGAAGASMAPGIVGGAGLALSGALLGACAFQGLAFIHHRTLGQSSRTAILAATYVLVFATQGLFLFFVGILGLADLALPLRKPLPAGPTGPENPSPDH
ncbi:MAG TPA: DUF2232 domain-containing protein [Microvirga sp.]|jgi:hypothetical protein